MSQTLVQLNPIIIAIFIDLIAILINLYTLTTIGQRLKYNLVPSKQARWLLLGIASSFLLENLAWLCQTIKIYLALLSLHHWNILIIRLAWIALVLRYLAFGWFIESLSVQVKLLKIFNRSSLCIGGMITAAFLAIILLTKSGIRPEVEKWLFDHVTQLYLPTMTFCCLLFAILILINRQVPNKLRRIVYLFTVGLIGPTILIDMIQTYQPFWLMAWMQGEAVTASVWAALSALALQLSVKQILIKPKETTDN